MTNSTIKTTTSAKSKKTEKITLECKVSYDVITKSDKVKHFVETVRAVSKTTMFKHLRIKNKSLGMVRNINILSEVQVA